MSAAAQQAYLHAIAGRDEEAEARYRVVYARLVLLSAVVEQATVPEREGE